MGQSKHHIRKSETDIKLQETDIFVSFDVTSLFTRVLVEDTIQILSQHFQKETIDLIQYILTTTYFVMTAHFKKRQNSTNMWRHGQEEVQNFLLPLNLHPNIKYTMEI